MKPPPTRRLRRALLHLSYSMTISRLLDTTRSSNRTGGFPASGSRKRLTRVRVTPPATSEHSAGWLDSSSIPMSFVASCVRLELRPLPSTSVTRFHRYCEPLRHPTRPGLSLTSGQLILIHYHHRWGFPCCVWSPLPTCHRHYPGRSDGACSLVHLHRQRPSLCNRVENLLMPESLQVRLGSRERGVSGSFAMCGLALPFRILRDHVLHSERRCAK